MTLNLYLKLDYSLNYNTTVFLYDYIFHEGLSGCEINEAIFFHIFPGCPVLGTLRNRFVRWSLQFLKLFYGG